MLKITPIEYRYELANTQVKTLFVENESNDVETYELPENYHCCAILTGTIETEDKVINHLLYPENCSDYVYVNANSKFVVYLKN